jgi:hypothetical protein
MINSTDIQNEIVSFELRLERDFYCKKHEWRDLIVFDIDVKSIKNEVSNLLLENSLEFIDELFEVKKESNVFICKGRAKVVRDSILPFAI